MRLNELPIEDLIQLCHDQAHEATHDYEDTVVMALRHPSGPPHERVLAAIDRLGRNVLTQLRSAGGDRPHD